MPEILFKRLFEVRILHGYYLDNWFADATGKKGIFQEFGTTAVKRIENQTFVLENKYNILQDLIIEPTTETQRLLRDLRMRWRTTPTGFIVGLEVNKQGTGTSTKFFPKQTLPDNIRWTFMLRTQNAFFTSFTNHALRPTLPARYYFSNFIPQGEEKTFPSLSMLLPKFSNLPNRTWEMGEIILSGNAVKAAKFDTNNGTNFIKLFDFNSNWHHFAHSHDRKVLPKSFLYRFDSIYQLGNAVNNVEFSLNDLGGSLVKKITQKFTTSAPASVEFPLDFNFMPIPANATENEKLNLKQIKDGWYDLVVKINNASFESRRVLLRSDLGTGQTVFGFVDITTEATAAQYSLFNAADKSLNTQLIHDADPLRWQGPVFEIRLLGRLAYWQYRLSKPLSTVPTDPDFLYSTDLQSVTTKEPRRFVAVRVPVKIGTDIQLPTPEPSSLKYDFENKQYFTETFLSTL
jgi:hypothetical protein